MSRTALDASPRWFEVPHKVVERGLGSLFVDTERPDGWRVSPLRMANFVGGWWFMLRCVLRLLVPAPLLSDLSVVALLP